MTEIDVPVIGGPWTPAKDFFEKVQSAVDNSHKHENSEAINQVDDEMLKKIKGAIQSSHSHDNSEELDKFDAEMRENIKKNTELCNKFGENEKGNLTYNGKLITERESFLISGAITDCFTVITSISSSVNFYLNNNTYEIKENEIVELENKEIKSFKINIEGTFVDIKNLSGYDGLPYVVNMDKLSIDNSGMLLALVIYSPGESEIIQSIQSYETYNFELEIYK